MELSHSQLFTEVIQQLSARFKPSIPLIKRQIEVLITTDYMERAELADGSAGYKYVA